MELPAKERTSMRPAVKLATYSRPRPSSSAMSAACPPMTTTSPNVATPACPIAPTAAKVKPIATRVGTRDCFIRLLSTGSISFNRVKSRMSHKNRYSSSWLAWLVLGSFPGGLPAQAPVTTQIATASPNVAFQVDGQWFHGTAVFTWPAGSKHLLAIDSRQYGTNTLQNTRYLFQHWNSSAGALGSSSNQVTITADAHIGWYRAELQVEYAIWLRFFHCGDACTSPGTVWINQIAYQQDTDVWADAGSTVSLDAAPNAGYVFAGWNQLGTAPLFSFALNVPTTLYPQFAVTRPVQLHTSPEGLQLLADRAPVYAPITLEWGWNTTHTLGVVSPQSDSIGRSWVFHSWSDGGQSTHSYQVEPGMQAASVVAEFLPRVAASLLTIPVGLTVTVDGQDAATPRNLSWAGGETHLVTAPLRQTDAAGTPWVFREWSNGAANAQSVSVSNSQTETGIRLT